MEDSPPGSGDRIIPIKIIGEVYDSSSDPANVEFLQNLAASPNARVNQEAGSSGCDMSTEPFPSNRASLIITFEDGTTEEDTALVTNLGLSPERAKKRGSQVSIVELEQDTPIKRHAHHERATVIEEEMSDPEHVVKEIQSRVIEVPPKAIEIAPKVIKISTKNEAIPTTVKEILANELEIPSKVKEVTPNVLQIVPENSEAWQTMKKIEPKVTEIQPNGMKIEHKGMKIDPKWMEITAKVIDMPSTNPIQITPNGSISEMSSSPDSSIPLPMLKREQLKKYSIEKSSSTPSEPPTITTKVLSQQEQDDIERDIEKPLTELIMSNTTNTTVISEDKIDTSQLLPIDVDEEITKGEVLEKLFTDKITNSGKYNPSTEIITEDKKIAVEGFPKEIENPTKVKVVDEPFVEIITYQTTNLSKQKQPLHKDIPMEPLTDVIIEHRAFSKKAFPAKIKEETIKVELTEEPFVEVLPYKIIDSVEEQQPIMKEASIESIKLIEPTINPTENKPNLYDKTSDKLVSVINYSEPNNPLDEQKSSQNIPDKLCTEQSEATETQSNLCQSETLSVVSHLVPSNSRQEPVNGVSRQHKIQYDKWQTEQLEDLVTKPCNAKQLESYISQQESSAHNKKLPHIYTSEKESSTENSKACELHQQIHTSQKESSAENNNKSSENNNKPSENNKSHKLPEVHELKSRETLETSQSQAETTTGYHEALASSLFVNSDSSKLKMESSVSHQPLPPSHEEPLLLHQQSNTTTEFLEAQQQPLTSQLQSSSDEKKSFSTEQKSSTSEEKSFATQQKLSTFEEKSFATQHKSSTSEEKFVSTQQKLLTSEEKYFITEQKSSPSEEKSFITPQKPSPSEEKSFITPQKPSTSEEKPFTTQQQSSSSVQRPFSTQEQSSSTEKVEFTTHHSSSTSEQQSSLTQQSSSSSEQKSFSSQQQSSSSEKRSFTSQQSSSTSEQKSLQKSPTSEQQSPLAHRQTSTSLQEASFTSSHLPLNEKISESNKEESSRRITKNLASQVPLYTAVQLKTSTPQQKSPYHKNLSTETPYFVKSKKCVEPETPYLDPFPSTTKFGSSSPHQEEKIIPEQQHPSFSKDSIVQNISLSKEDLVSFQSQNSKQKASSFILHESNRKEVNINDELPIRKVNTSDEPSPNAQETTVHKVSQPTSPNISITPPNETNINLPNLIKEKVDFPAIIKASATIQENAPVSISMTTTFSAASPTPCSPTRTGPIEIPIQREKIITHHAKPSSPEPRIIPIEIKLDKDNQSHLPQMAPSVDFKNLPKTVQVSVRSTNAPYEQEQVKPERTSYEPIPDKSFTTKELPRTYVRSPPTGTTEMSSETLGKSQEVRIIPISLSDGRFIENSGDDTQEITMEFIEMSRKQFTDDRNTWDTIEEKENTSMKEKNAKTKQVNVPVADDKTDRVIPIQLETGETFTPVFTKLEDPEPPEWSAFHRTGNEKERIIPITITNKPSIKPPPGLSNTSQSKQTANKTHQTEQGGREITPSHSAGSLNQVKSNQSAAAPLLEISRKQHQKYDGTSEDKQFKSNINDNKSFIKPENKPRQSNTQQNVNSSEPPPAIQRQTSEKASRHQEMQQQLEKVESSVRSQSATRNALSETHSRHEKRETTGHSATDRETKHPAKSNTVTNTATDTGKQTGSRDNTTTRRLTTIRSQSVDTEHRKQVESRGIRPGSYNMTRERSLQDINKDIDTIWKELQKLDSLPSSKPSSRSHMDAMGNDGSSHEQSTPPPPLSEIKLVKPSWKSATPSPNSTSNRGRSSQVKEKEPISTVQTTIWDLPPQGQPRTIWDHPYSVESSASKNPSKYPSTPIQIPHQDGSQESMSRSWDNKPQYNPVTTSHFSFLPKGSPTRPGTITPTYVTSSPKNVVRSDNMSPPTISSPRNAIRSENMSPPPTSSPRNAVSSENISPPLSSSPRNVVRSENMSPPAEQDRVVPVVYSETIQLNKESKHEVKSWNLSDSQPNLKSCLKTDAKGQGTLTGSSTFTRTRSESPAGRASPLKQNVNFRQEPTVKVYNRNDATTGQSTPIVSSQNHSKYGISATNSNYGMVNFQRIEGGSLEGRIVSENQDFEIIQKDEIYEASEWNKKYNILKQTNETNKIVNGTTNIPLSVNEKIVVPINITPSDSGPTISMPLVSGTRDTVPSISRTKDTMSSFTGTRNSVSPITGTRNTMSPISDIRITESPSTGVQNTGSSISSMRTPGKGGIVKVIEMETERQQVPILQIKEKRQIPVDQESEGEGRIIPIIQDRDENQITERQERKCSFEHERDRQQNHSKSPVKIRERSVSEDPFVTDEEEDTNKRLSDPGPSPVSLATQVTWPACDVSTQTEKTENTEKMDKKGGCVLM